MADNGCLLAAFAFAQNQVKLRVRFSLNNLKLDDDVLNIPLFQADQADRLISQALRIRGQAAGMFASALDKVVPVASLIVTVIVYVCLSQKSQPGLNKYDVTE